MEFSVNEQSAAEYAAMNGETKNRIAPNLDGRMNGARTHAHIHIRKCVEQIALNVLITENNVSELKAVVMATEYVGAAHKITANQ